ncbi:MAG: hypothetical protein Q8P41_25765 [Pseudomonadota bacterium]|nr:hypothetical protein [Pseudomonadota bacterium]
MKCYANQVTTRLLNIPSTAPVAVATNGTAYRLLPAQSDLQTDDTQDFRFVTSLTFAGGVTSPTAQLFLQGSIDGTNWIDLGSGTSRTADGTYREVIDNNGAVLLPWLRVRLALGGATNPNVYATVDVVSNGPFQLTTS